MKKENGISEQVFDQNVYISIKNTYKAYTYSSHLGTYERIFTSKYNAITPSLIFYCMNYLVNNTTVTEFYSKKSSDNYE